VVNHFSGGIPSGKRDVRKGERDLDGMQAAHPAEGEGCRLPKIAVEVKLPLGELVLASEALEAR